MAEISLLDPPSTVLGLGNALERRLRRIDLSTLAHLAWAPPELVSTRIGVSLARAEAFVAAANLLRVDGVSPRIADRLVRAGIDSVGELADAGLRTLERAVQKVRSGRPSSYKLAELQREGWRVRTTGTVFGRVRSLETSRPASRVEVREGRRRTTTDRWGRYVLDLAGTGDVTIRMGLPSIEIDQRLRRGEIARLDVDLPTRAPEQHLDEVETFATRLAAVGGGESRAVSVDDGAIADRTLLLVRERGPRRSSLVSLFRVATKQGTEVRRLRVDTDQLPSEALSGSVVRKMGSRFRMTPLTLRDVARVRFIASGLAHFGDGA